MHEGDKLRFRSFAERYLIARAPLFTVGKEHEHAWQALLDAKRFYKLINHASATFNDKEGKDDLQNVI